MAATYTLISSNVLSSSAASITFSSIPSTYTDLVLRVSARNSGAGIYFDMVLNSDTGTNYSETYLDAETGPSTNSGRVSNQTSALASGAFYISSSSDTANTFGSSEIYIPSYAVSQNKPLSGFSVRESNAAAPWIAVVADLWRNTATVSSILLTSRGTSFATGSSFYLYGIKNS